MITGVAVVDKPAGMTSHDVVAHARKALAERRVGHAGTLDPPATGVLVLGVGRATRLLRFAEAYDKEYTGTIVFGVSTTTLDATGDTTATTDASALTETAVRAALPAFIGDIEQIPPMVSAIKIGGERLYEKARRGEEVERAARSIRIDAFDVTAFTPGERAQAEIRVVCSKGTYIRSLAADLGDALGVGGHLAVLRRTRVGPFTADGALALDALTAGALRPMEDLLAGYPRRMVTSDEAQALMAGRRLPAAGLSGPYAVHSPEGLIAVAEDRGPEAASLCVVGER